MTMRTYERTITEYEISCDYDDCTSCYASEYPSEAMQNGFVKVEVWNGLSYYCRHFCQDCSKAGIKDLEIKGLSFDVLTWNES